MSERVNEQIEYCHIEYRIGERGVFGPVSLFVVGGSWIGDVGSVIYAERIVTAYNQWADRENERALRYIDDAKKDSAK